MCFVPSQALVFLRKNFADIGCGCTKPATVCLRIRQLVGLDGVLDLPDVSSMTFCFTSFSQFFLH